jgi:hypothetical protein
MPERKKQAQAEECRLPQKRTSQGQAMKDAQRMARLFVGGRIYFQKIIG